MSGPNTLPATGGVSDAPLSSRLRPDVEAAPWVIAEVKKLEQLLAQSRQPSAQGSGEVDKGQAFKDFCVFRGFNPTDRELTFFDAGFMASAPPATGGGKEALSDAERGLLEEARDVLVTANEKFMHKEIPSARIYEVVAKINVALAPQDRCQACGGPTPCHCNNMENLG